MIDLQTTISYTKDLMTALENVIVYDMKQVEPFLDNDEIFENHSSKDAYLHKEGILDDYNTCGYILASIRDIMKVLGDGQ